jgi:hypothetical protein
VYVRATGWWVEPLSAQFISSQSGRVMSMGMKVNTSTIVAAVRHNEVSGAEKEHQNIIILTSTHPHGTIRSMRTTLTIEQDVAVRLERERRKRGVGFKEIVNQVLRSGLDSLEAPARRRELFRTKGLALGQSRVGSLDNIEEVLSKSEGEDHQ